MTPTPNDLHPEDPALDRVLRVVRWLYNDTHVTRATTRARLHGIVEEIKSLLDALREDDLRDALEDYDPTEEAAQLDDRAGWAEAETDRLAGDAAEYQRRFAIGREFDQNQDDPGEDKEL